LAPFAKVIVGYEADGKNWKLFTSDNGVGMPDRKGGTDKTGLGTSLIKALAQQLEAQVDVSSGPKGTTVSVTHATFVSRLPTPA
jgi:chemotaxis protein methyltransferase CheR